MADWKFFEIDPQTERRILAGVLEVLRHGFGEVLITIHEHKVTTVEETKKRRIAEETTPGLNDNGLAGR